MKTIKQTAVILGLIFVFLGKSYAQTNIAFTSVGATSEGATQLYWASTNGRLYQIQYADALGTNSDGSTAWQVLYNQYPSHGSNTFIGDFGNYDVKPSISNPKSKLKRFYRVMDQGSDNDTTNIPSITITSPTNNDVLSGQITVSVTASCSNLPIVTAKLYVDGQEMDLSDDGTNYIINTCEWLNGSHTLFAVASAYSSLAGPSGSFPIFTSHKVSSYTTVTFSNLISGIAFSQPFFQPVLGQTQEVTATFAANCDWTLQIQDMDSNMVFNTSGSGNSLKFDWDGTGNGATNIPDGNYLYFISASTNGLADELISGDSSGGGSLLPSVSRFTSSESEASELWAISPNTDGPAVPLALYPPGFDTNGFTIFSAPASEVQNSRSFSTRRLSSFASASYSGPANQSSAAPTRSPTSPMKNSAGTFGIAYFDWSTPQTVSIPKNGITFPATGVCHLDGASGSAATFDSIAAYAGGFRENFIRAMSKGSWSIQYDRANTNLHANDMRRSDLGYSGGELFTTANIGLFLDHGNYGSDPDYTAGSSGSKQAYFRCSSDSGDNGWLRVNQIGFGGDLKWMGLLACNSLNTFSSMSSVGAIPLKTTHLVCGTSTISAFGVDFGALWAKKMLGGVFKSPEKIATAWFDAGHDQYRYTTNLTDPISFRVAGYPECMDDTIKYNVNPTSPSASPRNLTKVDQQVYP